MKYNNWKYRGIFWIGAVISTFIFMLLGWRVLVSNILITYFAFRLGWYMGEKDEKIRNKKKDKTS